MLNFKPRKRFGQHFLNAHNCQRIVDTLTIQPTDCLVEIGPGLGALTEKLLPLASQLVAIELDRDLVIGLQQRWEHQDKFCLYAADALDFDFSKLAKQMGKRLRIVGNLPYNIGTPLLFHLMQFIDNIQDIHVMLQKEVVDRLAATVGTPHYGRLSVMMQYHCQVQPLFRVPPGAFWPPPKVDSAVIKLLPWQTPPMIAQSPKLLTTVVRQAFSQKRKTLRNSLRGLISWERLLQLKINPQHRPEQLSVEDYIRLSNGLYQLTLEKISYQEMQHA